MAMTLSPSDAYSEHLFLFETLNPSTSTNTAAAAAAATFPLYGAYTPTTPTLTPTRLRSIKQDCEDELAQKPRQYPHQAGFVIPNVNFSLYMKPNKHLLEEYHHQQQQEQSKQQQQSSSLTTQASEVVQPPLESAKSVKSELYSSNSNDSYRLSDDYSSDQTSSSNVDNLATITATKTMSGRTSRMAVTSASNKRQQVSKNRNTADDDDNQQQQQQQQQTSNNKRQPKKSGGGRRPERIEQLTPEEEAKREKRRERNKQAAARCRKRRLDQTNQLQDETNEMAKENEELGAKLKSLYQDFQSMHARLCLHERQCLHNLKLSDNLETINFDLLNELTTIVPDEGADMFDDAASVSSSRNSTTRCSSATMPSMDHGDLSMDSMPFPSYENTNGGNNDSATVSNQAKRRRPNSLSVARSYDSSTMSSMVAAVPTTNNSQPSANPNLITPTHGYNFDGTPGFSLTPIIGGPDCPPFTPSSLARILGQMS